MVDADRTVTVTLKMDTRDYKRMLSDVEQTTRTTTQRAGRDFEALGQRVSRAGDVMSVGLTAPLVLLGKQAVEAASGLEQSVGAIESVFGDASRKIAEFGETAADSLGLSKREVNETASVLGASLQSMGFSAEEAADQVIGLQERAADMAATFGGTTREALDAIASLMRGERDPIERYGVAIKQVDINARVAADGLDTSTAAAETMSSATASLSLLMEQTGDVAGQFGREADTAAGAQARMAAQAENAKAALGDALLPIMSNVYDMAADVATAFSSLDPAMQKVIVAAGAFVAAAGPLLSVGGRIISNWDNIATAATAARTAMLSVNGVAFAGAGVAIGLLVNELHQARQAAEEMGDAIAAAAGPAPVDQIDAFTGALDVAMNERGSVWDRLIDAFNPAKTLREISAVEEYEDRVVDLTLATEQAAAAGRSFASHQDALNHYLQEGYTYADALALASVEMAQAAGQADTATDGWAQRTVAANTATEQAVVSLSDYRAALAGAGVDTAAFGEGVAVGAERLLELDETMQAYAAPCEAWTSPAAAYAAMLTATVDDTEEPAQDRTAELVPA